MEIQNRTRIKMKLAFFIGISFVTIILLAGAVFYLINGSLETEPSMEQQEKATIIGWAFTIVFTILSYLTIGKVSKGLVEMRKLHNH